MKGPLAGKRHPLLFYRRSMDRIFLGTLVLGLILGAVWAWSTMSDLPVIGTGEGIWLLSCKATRTARRSPVAAIGVED